MRMDIHIDSTPYWYRCTLGLLCACCLLCSTAASAKPGHVDEDAVFQSVVAEAEELAARPFESPGPPLPEVLRSLPEHGTRLIPFRPEASMWSEAGMPFRLRFFHRGAWFDRPVHIVEVVDGQARPVPYDPHRFDLNRSGLSPDSLGADKVGDLGYAGLTLYLRDPAKNLFKEKLSFLGASYFRAVGSDHHWGASSRGLAIDTFLKDQPEEFPHFEKFWLVRPKPNDQHATIYALLNGPSVTGAYRFVVDPGDYTTIDTEVALFFRHGVTKAGLAPLTSMFLMGEEQPGRFGAWRPEVHDSDGLLMVSQHGEHIWRPLDNPGASRVSRFKLESPRGFGLIQRDRAFRNYMDPNLEYHRRPSVWVEAHDQWGQGWVELIEFHSGDEDFDNVAAFWVPADSEKVMSGQRFDFGYTLWFCDDQPPLPSAGRFIETHRGVPQALFPGKRENGALRFVLFANGGGLDEPFAGIPDVVTNVTNGQVLGKPSVVRFEELGLWQVMIDAKPYDNGEPMELRAFLKRGDDVLTETWVYRWDWGDP